MPIVKVAICISALGLAFWVGRISSSGENGGAGNSNQSAVKSQQRAPRKNPARDHGLGAGDKSYTNALQMRETFVRSRGNMSLGSATAQITLMKMNATELSTLVHDLSKAQASMSGYSYQMEIQAACARWAEIDPDAALAFTLSNKQNSFRTAALNSIFTGMAAYDPELALSKLSEIKDPAVETSARLTVLRALSVSHPELWLSEFKSHPNLWRSISISSTVSEWAVDDPRLAIERLKQLPSDLQIQGVSTIGSIWASKNPQAAMAWAESLTNTKQRSRAISGIASGMATKDPQAALRILDGLDTQTRKGGYSSVFRSLANIDFDKAVDLATGLTNVADQKIALHQLLGGSNYGRSHYGGSWGNYGGGHTYASADQLRKLVNKLPTGSLRKQALTQLGKKLAAYPQEKINELTQGYTEKARLLLQNTIVQNLAYSDPERALKIYDSMPTSKRDHNQYTQILSYLAQRDPEASLARAMQAKTPELQSQAASYAISKLASDDPSATANRFSKLPEGPLRKTALGAIASAWSQSDPKTALQWAEGLPTEEKNRALSTIVPSLARSDTKAAAALVERALAIDEKGSSWSVSSAAQAVVQAMSVEDPTLAGDWIDRLPEGHIQLNAIRTLANRWSVEDIDGAADWINSLPDGKARDKGIATVVGTISSKDPAAAFGWANSLGNDSTRISSLSSVMYSWKRRDPDEARAAVERADLTDKERDRLMKILK